jgi:hypothetical protein
MQGRAGHVMVAVVAFLTVALYVLRYCYRRYTGEDRRRVRVFAFDVGKVLLGGCIAWFVLLVFAAIAKSADLEASSSSYPVAAGRPTGGNVSAGYLVPGVDEVQAADDTASDLRAAAAATHVRLQSVSWYPPALFIESTLGTFLGVSFARMLEAVCRRSLRTAQSDENQDSVEERAGGPAVLPRPRAFGCHSVVTWWLRFARCNVRSGRYSPSHHAVTNASLAASRGGSFALRRSRSSFGSLFDAEGENQDDVRFSWFCAQLTAWCLCVAVSRLITATLLLAFIKYCPPRLSPVVAVAMYVESLPLSCAAKQLWCFGVFRLVVDLVVLGVTDQLNRLKK